MENHPIPQDVTGFKFKLIGSMTVKQFLYILGFGILATITFVLQLNPFIKFPVMGIFAAIGVALAFLPIEGRPMDVMISNFAKTVPSENRYIFKKRGADLHSFGIFDPKPQTKTVTVAAAKQQSQFDEGADKRAALISRLRNSTFRPDESEKQSLNNIHLLFDGKTPTAASYSHATTQPQVGLTKDENVANTTPQMQQAVTAPVEQNLPQDIKVAPPQEAVKPSGEQESREMPKDIPAPKEIAPKPNPTLSGGFPQLPDVGNVMMGIVRDPRNKPLQNIIVEVIDSNGIPVRAFKTSVLGQFCAATQLPDGHYKIHFDDPGKLHEFKDTEVTLAGEIFQPLEIVSVDAREKLRQELFGGVPTSAAPVATA